MNSFLSAPSGAPPARKDRAILSIALGGAFVASLLAVSEHARCLGSGYDLGAASREHESLHREVLQAERRLAAARAPSAVLARMKSWKTDFDYFSQPAVHPAQQPLPQQPSPRTSPPSGIRPPAPAGILETETARAGRTSQPASPRTEPSGESRR